MFGIDTLINKELTVANVYSKLSDVELLDYYLGTRYKLGTAMSSPLRKDNNPSFGLYNKGNRIYFKDFKTGESGDIFTLIQKLKGLTFGQVLQTINQDFNLGLYTEQAGGTRSSNTNHIKALMFLGIDKPREKKIEVSVRNWNTDVDKLYWSSYAITCSTLNLYKVFPLNAYYLDDVEFKASKSSPMYGYYFGNNKWKIYQPFKANYKWINNADKTIIQGVDQIKGSGDTLIITKALKDVMCYRELGYEAIAPQSESSMIDLKQFNYTHYIINFDFDYTGVTFGSKYRELYDNVTCEYFTNGRLGTFDYKAKDLSDYIKLFGKQAAVDLLNNKQLNKTN